MKKTILVGVILTGIVFCAYEFARFMTTAKAQMREVVAP